MKVEIDIDIAQIIQGLPSGTLPEILSNFTEDQIMDAVEKADNERGDWIFLERMVKYISFLSVDLQNEIRDAFDGGHISEDTFKVLKKIQKIVKEQHDRRTTSS